MTQSPKRRGRPALTDEARRSQHITLRVTEKQKQAYTERGGDDWLLRELDGPPKPTRVRRAPKPPEG